MSFYDQVVQTNPYQRINGAPQPGGGAYANTWPLYEVMSPQYPVPAVYNLMRTGYKLNELIFSCIEIRADAVSEAHISVKKNDGTNTQDLAMHPLRKLMRKPNERMTEEVFWRATEIYCDIAGFSAWEIETNNLGDPIALWPMRPDWCSFMRGPRRPIDRIRYQPYGLPYADIAIENVLLFQYFDPEFPMLKGQSPTGIALREIGVDNNATDFLKIFFQRGTKMSGVLKTEQTLQDVEADRIRSRWKQTHGGVENWGDVAVLGAGVEYQSIQMNFRDMEFPELDARSESRIAMIFKIPPILIGAKIGLDRSTMANYGEAKSAFYERPVKPQWRYFAGEIREQLLPKFGEDPSAREVEFDTRDIKALQEDVNMLWTRATGAAAQNLLTRDEARKVMGFDPIDNATVYVGASNAMPELPELPVGDLPDITAETEPTSELADETEPLDFEMVEDEEAEPAVSEDEREAAQALEEKRFRAFAHKRIRQGEMALIQTFKWKFIPETERARLIAEVLPAKADPFQDYQEDDPAIS